VGGRDDVTVEVALRGVTTPLAVTEWRRLPAKVRQALPPPKTSALPLPALSAKSKRPPRSLTSANGTMTHGSQPKP
jgi:hypothetical protein